MNYKGYTIEEDFRNPYSNNPDYMFYPTSEGIQHDADQDSDGMRYCGNCKWSHTIEDAKDQIDKLTMIKFMISETMPLNEWPVEDLEKLQECLNLANLTTIDRQLEYFITKMVLNVCFHFPAQRNKTWRSTRKSKIT